MLRLFSRRPQRTLANAAREETVMDVENTDLNIKQRVLAHEQILQVLIAVVRLRDKARRS